MSILSLVMNMKNILKNERKNIVLSLAVGTVLALIFTVGFSIKLYADSTQASIASKVIRLHVIANSDSDYDAMAYFL